MGTVVLDKWGTGEESARERSTQEGSEEGMKWSEAVLLVHVSNRLYDLERLGLSRFCEGGGVTLHRDLGRRRREAWAKWDRSVAIAFFFLSIIPRKRKKKVLLLFFFKSSKLGEAFPLPPKDLWIHLHQTIARHTCSGWPRTYH